MNLAERLLALHASLEAAGIDHAFGGAIALAYWTLEPRGTRDIDINVFVPSEDAPTVLEALPDGVLHDEKSIATIRRDGQVRLWWEDTPVDLFFDNLPVHEEAARHRRMVPFEGEQIPVLGPAELALFKVMFDRTRDWADIEAMIEAENLDIAALRAGIAEFVGTDDPRLARLDDAVRRARAGSA